MFLNVTSPAVTTNYKAISRGHVCVGERTRSASVCASFVLFDSGNVVVTREDIVRLTTENHRVSEEAHSLNT